MRLTCLQWRRRNSQQQLLWVLLTGASALLTLAVLFGPLQSPFRYWGRPPPLVHQMCSDLGSIPRQYRPYAESWLTSHPRHRYLLWTDSGLRRLLARHYPEAANWTRRLLRSRLEFSDVARYYLLLHYGGIYADLDVRARRQLPAYLDSLANRKSAACGCYLGQEPVAHAVLLFGLPWLPSNALMACSPGHSFLRFVTDLLPLYVSRRASALPGEGESRLGGFGANKYTGPLMLYRFLRKFERQRQCKPSDPSCSVCLMEPEATMPYVDPSQRDLLRERCRAALSRRSLLPSLTSNALRANFCAGPGAGAIDWLAGTPRNGNGGIVFAEHDFLHLAYGNWRPSQ
uniref:Alpha-1,4-N-acetylglucosaminyltransferase n=1 Tax=Macrostomum lignano TaxID=282301 RepID=A0A1I8HNU8_9PLAT